MEGHQWPSVSPWASPVHALPSSINSSCVPLTPLHCTHNTDHYGATVASVPVSPGAAKGQGLELVPLVCSVPRTHIYLLLLLDGVLVVEQIHQKEAWGWDGEEHKQTSHQEGRMEGPVGPQAEVGFPKLLGCRQQARWDPMGGCPPGPPARPLRSLARLRKCAHTVAAAQTALLPSLVPIDPSLPLAALPS